MAYVDLVGDNGGILLNISEGGIALQSALMLAEQQLEHLRFQLPGSRDWIETNGRMAWISESKKEAGVQFADLPETARVQIREWMTAAANPPDLSEPNRGKIFAEKGKAQEAINPERLFSASMNSRNKPQDAARQEHGFTSPPETRVPPLDPSAASSSSGPRLGDYSIFPIDPRQETEWIRPAARRRSWPALAFLGILFAVLFFILGAAVGQGTVDHWIAYAERVKDGWGTPAKAASAPAKAPEVSAPAAATDPPAQPQDNTPQPQTEQRNDPSVASQNGATQGSATQSGAIQGSATQGATTQAGGGAATQPGSDAFSKFAEQPGASLPTQGHAPRTVVAPQGRGAGAADAPSYGPTERSILVTAPQQGSPAFLVNLPDEAVSASPTVAISSRRSIRVPPVSNPYAPRAERVIIGKLVSHGEPYYPAEARRRHVEGIVEISAVVGSRGEITSADVVAGPPLLAAAAVEAIRDWRYEPTFINGDPVQVRNDIVLVFRLP